MISIAIIEDDEDIRESLEILVRTTEGFICTGRLVMQKPGSDSLSPILPILF